MVSHTILWDKRPEAVNLPKPTRGGGSKHRAGPSPPKQVAMLHDANLNTSLVFQLVYRQKKKLSAFTTHTDSSRKGETSVLIL